MARPPQSLPTSSLPGPVTAPASIIPNVGSPIQQISPSSTISSTVTSVPNRFVYPWKFEGYKAFSGWMASEDDFFIIRRFQDLNARTILWMQYRIVQIEDRIKKSDKMVEDADVSKPLRNDSLQWDKDHMQERHVLMGELSSLLHHYNQYIESYSKIRERPQANKHQINNVKNWLARGAIEKEEHAYIENTGDLISINHRTRSLLGRLLESIPAVHRMPPFRTKRGSNGYEASDTTLYSSNARFDLLMNIATIGGGLVMLLAPLWWLNYIDNNTRKLGIITGFICLFTASMLLTIPNKSFEVVAATAAYAAVLMVFMQVVKSGDSG